MFVSVVIREVQFQNGVAHIIQSCKNHVAHLAQVAQLIPLAQVAQLIPLAPVAQLIPLAQVAQTVHVNDPHENTISVDIKIISQLLFIHNILSIFVMLFATSRHILSLYSFIFFVSLGFISNNLTPLSLQSTDIIILLIVWTALSKEVSTFTSANTAIDPNQIIILKKIIIRLRNLILCFDHILLLWKFKFFIIVFIFIKIYYYYI